MIKEFAVEPAAIVDSYRDFCYVTEKFGISEGRVISQYPSKWKKMVYEAAQARHAGTVEYARFVERLKNMPTDLLMPFSRPGGNGNTPWVTQALAEHARLPFDYLLTQEVEDLPLVVKVSDIDGEHACFTPSRQLRIRREANEMADACNLLLRSATRIKLIDPYFDFLHERFRAPFFEFIERLRPNTVVEIFRNDSVATDELRRRGSRYLPERLPRSIRVCMHVWTQDVMHNRYLMSNHGGAIFGVGLDAAEDEAAREDEVTIMQKDIWLATWDKYSNTQAIAEWIRT
ncbi:hypothetical protein [Chitinibacter tainanensis]|uniref:hypothetical protein n=1 Tax=Chitinibacter tainanensis TaxID=230667 RepID=UPI0023539822|nr:hypothetical protein [Chitinibacter tainanensis]